MKIFINLSFFLLLCILTSFGQKIFSQNAYLLLDTVEKKADFFIVGNIKITGNKITKEHIIRRELTFKKGDTIQFYQLEFKRSKENLLNRSLFNYVRFDTAKTNTGDINVLIDVDERWYTWPGIILTHADRNFSSWLKSRDIERLTYGLIIDRYNFRGVNETVKLKFIGGFSQEFGIEYRDIFLDIKRKHALSVYIGYEQQTKLSYNTIENRQIVLNTQNKLMQQYNATLKYSYREKYYNKHNAYISYYNYEIADTIINLNPEFIGGGKKLSKFLIFNYTFARNKTDAKYYPLKGHSLMLKIKNTYPLQQNNLLKQTYIVAEFNKYFNIKPRWHFATSTKIKQSLNKQQPYLLKKALGYSDNLRGFDYYVIDGQHFYMFRNNLKFTLLHKQYILLNYFPFNKLPQFNKVHYASYLNLFFDMGYVAEDKPTNSNSLANQLLYSYGFGVDVVTYYDRILRIDFARNSLNENGIFISFSAAF